MTPKNSTALAVVDHDTGEIVQHDRRPVPGLIRPIARPDEMLKVQEEVRTTIAHILQEGRDYGKIPGCGDKPAMLKPGAERATMAFGCYSRFRVMQAEIDHDREVPWSKTKKVWANGRPGGTETTHGTSIGLYRYVVECEIVHRESDTVVGSCVASCSTMESKYVDRPRDSENTVLKMAEKRAHVGAVLNAFGLSEQFTQDIEEAPELYQRGGHEESSAPAASANEPEAKCPVCDGKMWDNRESKKNPKAPDFKCRDKKCEGAYWPGQWPPQPEEDKLADLSAQMWNLVKDIRALDEEAGAAAEAIATAAIDAEDVTPDSLKAAGRKLFARLERLKKKAEEAPEPTEPDPASYGEGTDTSFPTDDELPFT